jgi:hypothetical protein
MDCRKQSSAPRGSAASARNSPFSRSISGNMKDSPRDATDAIVSVITSKAWSWCPALATLAA